MSASESPARPEAPRDGAPARHPVGPRVFAGVLFVSGGGLFWYAFTESGDDPITLDSPHLAPLVVTGLWTVLAAVLLVKSLVRPDEAPPADPETDAGETDPADVRWLTPALLAVALVGYVLLLPTVGFLITTTVFFFAAAVILGSRRWWRDGVIAVVLSTAVYFAFTRLLDIFLPSGVLPI
ncbi:putative tricarboxylic transport membrane protein [Stackebrandtia albiflava]|uniref:Putative tricarboxylic transport membrane protein n=1 Tax=Stackebrandtia albiflava TaxID=406432 RepID=A0A562V4A1_9ACTN|nr:tripartite tricarboxylate transporter TctB family protein [Stackebrandtia albiflava]TWJ12648.1 putative tricarboxylic transport membrane protein [Stackebrandtia albiflava]